MIRRRIRGVLFDKDGTLIDSYRTWFPLAQKMALEAAGGSQAGAEARLRAVGYDFASSRFLPDSVFAAGTNAEIVDIWYPGLSEPERRERLREFDARSVSAGGEQAVAIEGAIASVRVLHGRGLRLGVATNDSTGGAEATLAMLGIAQLFDAVFGYDAVARPKPAPDVLIAFSDMTGLRPDEIAIVGDNRHDLETGRAAGAGLSVGVLSGTGTRETLEPLADIILDSVVDLPDWLVTSTRA